MQNIEQKTPLANNHISVDCVVIGFDGEQLKVLLIKRAGEEEGEIFHDMKLPGHPLARSTHRPRAHRCSTRSLIPSLHPAQCAG